MRQYYKFTGPQYEALLETTPSYRDLLSGRIPEVTAL
jgi:hypothetical protein